MHGLWQTIIGGLAVAAISGLTVVAYRNPKGYHRIYVPVVCLLAGGWGIWFVYGLGYTAGFGAATLDAIKLNANAVIKVPSHGSPSFWLYMAPAILYAYLSLLRILPHLLGNEASGPDQNTERGEE